MPSKFLEQPPFGHTYTRACVGQRFSQWELTLSALLIPIGDLKEYFLSCSKLPSLFLSYHDKYLIRPCGVKSQEVHTCNTLLHSPAFSLSLSLPCVQIMYIIEKKRNKRNDW